MRYIPDASGQFRRQPFYEPGELDALCEALITEFMNERCGGFTLPIPTDVLEKLIERDVESYDSHADLSAHGPNAHGVTYFFPDGHIEIAVSRELQHNEHDRHNWREVRLRTTLAHEYGHAALHALSYFQDRRNGTQQADSIVTTPGMEWQANYFMGALLIPVTSARQFIADYGERIGCIVQPPLRHGHRQAVVEKAKTRFAVSEELATRRFKNLSLITYP